MVNSWQCLGTLAVAISVSFGIKKNNSQNNFSMRCEMGKLRKKKEIYQSRVSRDGRNVARIKCRLFVSSLRVSDFYPDDPESKHVVRINVGKTNVWQLRRMHFRTTRSVADPLAYRPTCFKWLIGSMNECYIEINQDFTKVKTTNSILISRLVYDCNFLYIMPLIDEYKYILPPSRVYIWRRTNARMHPPTHFKFQSSLSPQFLRKFNVDSFILRLLRLYFWYIKPESEPVKCERLNIHFAAI